MLDLRRRRRRKSLPVRLDGVERRERSEERKERHCDADSTKRTRDVWCKRATCHRDEILEAPQVGRDPVPVGVGICGAVARAGRSHEREKGLGIYRDDPAAIGARSKRLRK